jgi:UPF0176 protein
MDTINIAAYRFVTLDNLPQLRAELKGRCLSLELKGTILLAPEGVNLFLAGAPESITTFIAGMDADSRFRGMEYKRSISAEQPFNRMLVKLKKEIISMGLPAINPAEQPAPALAARTLKAWLDEGRDVVLLDTRNQYEIRLGSFRDATHLDIDTFRSFPSAAAQLDESLKDKTVVTFCTGGIRCEKAAPLLTSYGFKHVFQLEGGILKYFEEVGDAHYDGECFVFDRRVALNGKLEDAGTVQCFNCLSPVRLEEQRSPEYTPNISCPHCARGKPVKRLAA